VGLPLYNYKDISVIIPCYNSAQTIGRTLESILSQTLKPKEIIVVDDASLDNIKATLIPYKKDITLVEHKKNMGAAAARNTGIKQSKGNFLAFLDADDTWRPNKLEYHLNFIKRTNADISCSSFMLHRNGISTTHILNKKNTSLLSMLDGCRVSPGSTLIAKRKTFTACGLFPTQLSRLEDWAWLITILYKKEKFSVCPEILSDIYTISFPAFENISLSLTNLKIYLKNNQILLGINEKRHFSAALSFELAAAYKRSRKVKWMIYYLIKSFFLNPKLFLRTPADIKRIFLSALIKKKKHIS